MPRRVTLLTLLCLLVLAGRAAHASTQGRTHDDKELGKAEAVLSKLRRLEEAAPDAGSFERAARGLFPKLYASVYGLREGNLKTDLSTAVALYESALRAGAEGGGAAPDCSREMREAYARLCLESAGRAALLRAKARMHARWAGVELLYARGERGDATLEAHSAIRAERATDRALAEEALHVLEGLAKLSAGDAPADAEAARRALSDEHEGRASGKPAADEDLAGRLEQLDRILASLPRDGARRLLREARDAFRDGLYWRLKAAPAHALVVNANAFAEYGSLPRLGLRADDAVRAERANLRAALRFIGKARELMGRAGRNDSPSGL